MVLGGGAFGRCLGHESGAVMDRVSAHINETPGSREYTADDCGSSRMTASKVKQEKQKLCHVAIFMFPVSAAD